MKTFSIFGAIIDTEDQAWSFEDVTPTQIKSFLSNLEPNEDVVFEINSPGGSVSAGISICNLIKQTRFEGHKVTTHVIGLAASIASVIACSGDELQIDSNAFMMIHLPYMGASGNSVEFEKYVDVLKQNEQAIISVYKTKFDLTDEQLYKMMLEETWFLGSEKDTYKLNAKVIETTTEYKIAACVKNMENDFKKIPNKLKDLIHKDENMPKPNTTEPVEDKVQETISDNVVDNNEKPVEEKPVEDKVQETVSIVVNTEKPSIIEPVEMVTLDECEKRVSGMQSTMAKQIESLKKENETVVNDLKVQLEAKVKELETVKNESISLKQSLDTVTNELQETASALEAKTKALETLNANVNTTPDEIPTMEEGLAKCKTPSEKVAFLKSGKYKRK